MAGDSWLSDYDACARLGQDIMEKINERNKHSRTSSAYTKISAQVRVSMKQFSGDLGKLRQNLMRASSSYHITQREVERRQMQLDALTTKEKQLEQAFRNETGETRQSLLGGRGTDTFTASDPWGMNEEPEEFRGVGNADIQAQQQDIIREQDHGLEALSHVISRQKQMAVDIGNEVDSQNDMASKLKCWMCDKECGSRRELKNHVAKDDHGALRVLCVWCDDGKTFRRALDLKLHVDTFHAEEKVDSSLLKEIHCFWFALKPEDYRKTIGQPTESEISKAARALVLNWLDDGNLDQLHKRTKKQWVDGWGVDVDDRSDDDAVSIQAPSEDELMDGTTVEPYDPLQPGIPDFELRNVNLSSTSVDLDWEGCGGEWASWKWLHTSLRLDVLNNNDISNHLSSKLVEFVGRHSPGRPRHEGLPVPTDLLHQLTQALSSSLGFSITPADLKTAFFWLSTASTPHPSSNTPMRQVLYSKMAPRQLSQDSTARQFPLPSRASTYVPLQKSPPKKQKTDQNVQDRAREILVKGSLPLIPSARRDWMRRREALVLGSVKIDWPPRGWTGMTADQKLLHWEHCAMHLEEEVQKQVPDVHRSDLLIRYNFLALPGTADPRVEDSEIAKARFYNYKFLVRVALTKNTKDLPPAAPCMVEMLERSLMLRDVSLDSLLQQIKDVPLWLEA